MTGTSRPSTAARRRWAGLSLLALFEAGTALMLLTQWGIPVLECHKQWWTTLVRGEVSVDADSSLTPLGVACQISSSSALSEGVVHVVLWPTLVSLCLVAVALVATIFLLSREWVTHWMLKKEDRV